MTLPIGGRPILFVGGKGGVGKTTTATALALRLAEEGERILLVSTDPAHSLGDIVDREIGDREVEIFRHAGGSVTATEIDARVETDRYLEGVRDSMRAFVRPGLYAEIERQIELAREAPGAAEAALMDRVAELMASAPERFHRVIFDTAPTGHTLRLLALPELMTAWTDGLLRRRERSDALGRAVRALGGGKPGDARGEGGRGRGPDAGEGGGGGEARGGGPRLGRDASPPGDMGLLDTPDEAPSDPRIRRLREVLLDRRRRFSQARRLLLDPDATGFLFVLNPEKLPLLETQAALRVLESHRVPVVGVVVNRVLPRGELGAFLEARREQEATWLDRIDQAFAHLPRTRVPLEPRDVEGVEGLRRIGEALDVEREATG